MRIYVLLGLNSKNIVESIRKSAISSNKFNKVEVISEMGKFRKQEMTTCCDWKFFDSLFFLQHSLECNDDDCLYIYDGTLLDRLMLHYPVQYLLSYYHTIKSITDFAGEYIHSDIPNMEKMQEYKTQVLLNSDMIRLAKYKFNITLSEETYSDFSEKYISMLRIRNHLLDKLLDNHSKTIIEEHCHVAAE